MKPIAITGARAAADLENSSMVVITLATKYAGERSYSLPRECLDALISDLQQTKLTNGTPSGQKTHQMAVKTPKKWMIGTGLPNHAVVLVLFDPQSDDRGGYALNPGTAKEMAAALVKNAEAVSTQIAGSRH